MKASTIELYINDILHSAFPIYSDKISVNMERQSDEMFYRTSLNATFTFVREDFDTLYNASLDDSFELRLKDSETGLELARGYFSKTDCHFDVDSGICEVKITGTDKYDKILQGKDNEYDLIKLAPARETVKLTKRAILQIYVGGDTKITNVIGNMSYEVDTEASVDINGESYNVEDLTPQQLVDNFSFTHHNTDALLIGLSGATHEEFPNVDGQYNFIGEVTYSGITYYRYTNSNNLYYIDLHRTAFGTREGVVRNSAGTIITDSEGQVIFVEWHRGAYSTVKQGVYLALGSGGVYHIMSECGNLSDFTNGFFTRILLDTDSPATPMGAIRRLAPGNDICTYNLNYRFTMPTSISGLADKFISSFAVQTEPTKFGVNGDGKYYIQPSPLSAGDNVIPIGWNTWIPASFWFNSTVGIATILDQFDTEWDLQDAFPLWSVIQVLLAQIDPTISFGNTSAYSTFLYGDISQSVIPGWVKNLLYITPITNIKKTYYNMAARKGTITLANIFDLLRATCQLYWFIDDQNRLRFEHITWFKNGGNYSQVAPLVDLTAICSPKLYKTWDYELSAFDYDKSNIVKRYEFSWSADVSEVFDGFAIDIKNKYADDCKTNSVSVNNFISDLDLIMSAPDVLSDDCFAVIGVNSNKVCVIQGIGNFGMDFVAPVYVMQNPYLSFYFAELVYWMHNLGGNNAEVTDYKTSTGDNGKLRVLGTQKIMTQHIKFPIDANKIGKEGLFRTQLGDGEWTKATYTPEDGMLDTNILL